jgi:hydroxymethylpyrimidine/phosphomethylpyrimidine kinase
VIPNALTIAGSDSGGGAGLQADLKTFSALGVYGASVITALTAQNTQAVRSVYDLPPEFIRVQLDAVLGDLHVHAVKVGMLSQFSVIDAVAEAIAEYALRVPLVLDPVMKAQSGAWLLQQDALVRLQERLVPLATLITPNVIEAGILLGEPTPTNEVEMVTAAKKLWTRGARAVLVKGGHVEGEHALDILYDGIELRRYIAPRWKTINTHGTGCTLASAITAFLARGFSIPEAVRSAKDYVTAALRAADTLRVGKGHGPLHHFHAQWYND